VVLYTDASTGVKAVFAGRKQQIGLRDPERRAASDILPGYSMTRGLHLRLLSRLALPIASSIPCCNPF
jgi:hypothetical protein